MKFRDIDAPNTYWRPQSENPIPWVWNVIPGGAAFWRIVSARPLDGHARTDATFLKPGTKVFTKDGRCLPYQKWPRWKQAVMLTRLPPFIALLIGMAYLYWGRDWSLLWIVISALVLIWLVTDKVRFFLGLLVLAAIIYLKVQVF